MGEHVDTGLFNVVIGRHSDLEPLHLRLGGEGTTPQTPLSDLLPRAVGHDVHSALLALVIPGYTQQLLDPLTRAVPHSGAHCWAPTHVQEPATDSSPFPRYLSWPLGPHHMPSTASGPFLP